MSFVGKTEDIGLPELVQFIASNQKTGKLTLTRPDAYGLIIFRNGRIIYAASSSVRETFGNILVCRGLIDEATLLEALERQHLSPEQTRLGSVLIEMGKLQKSALEDVMRYQTGHVLQELFQWEAGFFKFENLELPEGDEIEVDAKELVVMEGLNTERLLIDVVSRLDDIHADEAAASILSNATDARSPALRGEITLELLRSASVLVNRGVLLIVRGTDIGGLGQFGIDGVSYEVESAIQQLRLPLNEPSVFSNVVESNIVYRGGLPRTPVNERFAAAIGGAARDVAVVPSLVGGRVAMVLYADNLKTQRPVGPTESLERLMAEAGRAIAKEAADPRALFL